MKNEDKIKTISELYSEKSKILSELSDLNTPDYRFGIGKIRIPHGWVSSNEMYSYNNLETGFLGIVKK